MFNPFGHHNVGSGQLPPSSLKSGVGTSSKTSIGQDDKQPMSQHDHHSGSQVGRDSDLFESGHPHRSENIPEAKFDPIATNYNPEVNMERGISSIDKEKVGKGTSTVFRGEPTADHEKPPQFED